MYLVYESLYGDLLNECDSTCILGLYADRASAIRKAKEMIQEDLKLNGYILDSDHGDVDSGFARLFWNRQENWNCYYEIYVKEMKVINE